MGLINWWPLNGSLEDYIGKNDLVATTGFSSSNAGKIGRCYTASAKSASAQSKNSIMTEGSFSLCCWFKLTDVSQNPTAIVTFHDHTATSNIGINLGDSKLSVSIGYTDGSREWNARKGTTTISANAWYHAAVTYNHNTKQLSLYLNGVREYTGTLTKTVKFTSTKLSVNWWSTSYSGGYFTTGFYNDIRVYNHELSYKEVKEISKGLMIHYDCNSVANTYNVGDSSGFKYHAAIPSTNMPTLTKDDSYLGTSSFLFSNGSKQSNGLYQYFESKDSIRIPESGTLNYFLKQSGTQNSDNHYAVGFQNFCSINGFGSGSEMGLIYYHDASNYSSKTNATTLRDGNWHMYTVSWSVNGTLKNYVDGVLIGSHTIGAMAHAGTFRKFVVGSAWTIDYGGFSGYLDDIKVYATQLSDNDVAELYKVKASISRNGKLFANEICEISLTNMTTKTAYSASWVRIFYHNNNSGSQLFGSDKNQFLRCNDTYRKSDLWALEHFRGKDGKFEFLLEAESTTGYNRWKQSTNFTKTTSISGYEAVQISWSDSSWGGLALSQDSGSTWVDGSPNSGSSSWWYAIGCKAAFQGGIPGPSVVETKGFSLWVRYDNAPAVNVNKKGILFANEICEVDNTSMKTKTELGANWVRLFYHNNQSGTVLFSSNKNEFLRCNDGGNKISDLWALEQFRGKDGKFELLLQYQSGGTSYNRWKQSSNFTKESIAGYEAVQVSWTTQGWGGLELNTHSSDTWVDGTVNHANWYYAIGARTKYSTGIPSWTEAENGWVEIWVRCDDINLFRIIKGGKCKATEFIEI